MNLNCTIQSVEIQHNKKCRNSVEIKFLLQKIQYCMEAEASNFSNTRQNSLQFKYKLYKFPWESPLEHSRVGDFTTSSPERDHYLTFTLPYTPYIYTLDTYIQTAYSRGASTSQGHLETHFLTPFFWLYATFLKYVILN